MSRLLPVLMRREDIVVMKTAMALTRKSESTIRRLCRQHGLARQTSQSAPLEISLLGLEMVLHGDLQALELLRAGQRSSPEVRRYVDHLSLPV